MGSSTLKELNVNGLGLMFNHSTLLGLGDTPLHYP
jgi:hypothetical protein